MKKEKLKVTREEFQLLYNAHLIQNRLKSNDYEYVKFSLNYEIEGGLISKENHKEEIYTIEDISEEKLLSKNGKKLVGGALKMKLQKIAAIENIKIKYKNEIIGK